MNFSTVSKVQATIRAGDECERVRGINRTKVLNAANGDCPLTPEEKTSFGLKINVNWGELAQNLAHARRQYVDAFLGNGFYFRIKIPTAPAEHQSEWEEFITQEINRVLRKSRKYFELHNYRWSSVVTHGVGAMRWKNPDDWCPKFVPMSDLRIPTDTTTDFENLGWYAVKHTYTPFELVDEAFRPGSGNGWDKPAVMAMLKANKEINWDFAPNNYNMETDTEKLAELVKQNGGYFASDAMPGIPLWHFFFEDLTGKTDRKWFLRIVPAEGAIQGTSPDKFLWESETPIADHWKHLIHVQYGDLSTDAPTKHHSVRSLGFMLLEPTFYTNLLRCKLLDHVFGNFNTWLRISDPSDKARAVVQEFANMSVLREGVSIVPRDQRHQIDAELVDVAMNETKQLQQNASSVYTQQTDTGTSKEQTAFETKVKENRVNAMLSGLLDRAFKYESFADEEICRRFCRPNSKDPDVEKFHKRAKAADIPQQWLDVDLWDVEPVSPLGMGNPTAAQAAAKDLIELRPMLDPTAQQEALHEVVLTVTQDPRKAARWVPLGKGRGATPAMKVAEADFNTLMRGIPVNPMEGISLSEQIGTMLGLIAGEISMDQQDGNMINARRAKGYATVNEHLMGSPGQNGYPPLPGLITKLAQDPTAVQQATKFSKDLGNLMNEVKGMAQRGQEAAQKQAQAGSQGNGQDPAAAAKLQEQLAQGQIKLHQQAQEHRRKEQEHRQKLKHESEAFVREQRRQDASTFAEIQRQGEAAKAANKMKSLKGDDE